MRRVEIARIFAREVLDGRGTPTIEVEVETDKGKLGRAMVPAGFYTRKNEAWEMRDNNVKRYQGNGVQNAVENVNRILARELVGMNALEQSTIDKYMIYIDDTNNKSSLGANAILGVSMAIARAAANCLNIPLYMYIGGISGNHIPTPMMNMICSDQKEFMIVPNDEGVLFAEQLRMCSEVYQELRTLLQQDDYVTCVSEVGSFCTNFSNDRMALDYLMQAIEKAGYQEKISIAMDVVASRMYQKGKYYWKKSGDSYSAEELIGFYEELCQEYPIMAIEDGLAEEDWQGWQKMTNALSKKIYLVGDDLFTTNPERLKKGIQEKVANSILIKPNQIGTVTEAIETIKLAKANGYTPIISHRTGETEDDFIADFAVALNIKYLKGGAPVRSEHTAKYNQLLRIEENFLKVIEE